MTKESKLSKHKISFLDSPKKLKLTPTAGKEKPLPVRAFNKTVTTVRTFILDLYRAAKSIIRETL